MQWRRPRKRVHLIGPKIGIRACRPDQIWPIDTTVIRLLDGNRAYLRAIIDNFSRRILAWKVSATFDPSVTAALLHQAVSGLSGEKPTLLADAGVENCNGAVDRLIDSGLLKRIVAMTEISFSNSLIEVVVAGTQAPMAISEHARHGGHVGEAGRFLRRRTQHAASTFSVSRSDAGRDVLRHGRACARGIGNGPARGTSGTAGDEPQDELSAMRAADGAGQLIIGPCKSTPDACSASNRDGQKHWPTRPGDTRRLKSGRHRHSSLWPTTSFPQGGDDPRGKVQISLARRRPDLDSGASSGH